MVEVVPFRGLRYNQEVTGALDPLVAPPYDVISPQMQDSLHERNPYNVVRLILGKETEADTETDNRYTRAAHTFREWRDKKVLTHDSKPGFYVYSQEYQFAGRKNVRIGFFARVRLEDFSAGNICPHEFTLAKAKQDRAQLIKACHANFSPIFGLYSDPQGEIDRKLTETTRSAPVASISDNGILNNFWRLDDPGVQRQISEKFLQKKIYIADGHHRYETALGFHKEHGNRVKDSAHVMMFLTNLDSQSLAIYPIHRLVRCPEGRSPQGFIRDIRGYFEVEPLTLPAPMDLHLTQALSQAATGGIAFVAYLGRGEAYLLKVRDTTRILPLLAPEDPADLQILDVVQLHTIAFKHLLGIDTKTPEGQKFMEYKVDRAQALALVDSGKYDLGFFLNATQIQQVRDLAEKGIRLPQKATYFYPKLLSGLVINTFES